MNTPWVRRTIKLIFFIGIFFFFLFPVGGDGDVFHHLHTGKFFLENGQLPNPDIWTYTAMNKPWVPHSWLSGVLFELAYRTFGPLGLSILVATIAVLTFALLFWLLRLLSISFSISLLVTAFSASVVSTRWPNRPEIMMYPLLVSLLLVNELQNRYPKAPLVFPLIILIWANLYGSGTFVGLGVLGIVAANQLLINRKQTSPVRRLFYLSLIASVAAAFINPVGSRSLFYIFTIPDVASVEGEWAGLLTSLRSPPINVLLVFQYRALLYLLFVATVIVVGIIGRQHLRRCGLFGLLGIAVFLPVLAFRHVPLAILLSAPLLGLLLQRLSQRTVVVAIGIALSLFSISISLWIAPRGLWENQDDFPGSLATFLNNHQLTGGVLAPRNLSSFLSYRGDPNLLVYWDTRDELFIDHPFGKDYITAISGNSVLPMIAEYKPEIIVVDLSEGPASQSLFYDQRWAPVFLSERHVIFVPTGVAQDRSLPTLPFLDPFAPAHAKPGKEDTIISLEQRLFEESHSFTSGMQLAQTLEAQGKINDAIEALQRIEIGRRPVSALLDLDRQTFLSQLFLKKNDCARALEMLQAADRNRRWKLLFTPWTPLPSSLDNIRRSYEERC